MRPNKARLTLPALAALGLAAAVLAGCAATRPRADAAAATGASAAVLAAPSPLELAAPTGTRPIGAVSLYLVDRTRVDPLAGTPGPRELSARVWYPAASPADGPPVGYMSEGVSAAIEGAFGLPAGTFGELSAHASASPPVADGRHPLLLFSHGLGAMHQFDTSLLEELASRGYVVAAIDHTYDAAVVELPDGRVVPGIAPAVPDPAQRRQLLSTRVDDLRFVLDRLVRLTRAESGLLAGHLDLRRIGALGHSFGGATVASAMLIDRRIVAGADLDGRVWGRVVSKGLDRPFMLLVGDSLTVGLTPDQARFFTRLRSERHALRLVGAGHFSFTDVPQFADALPGLDQLFDIGSIDAAEATREVRAYVTAFFDEALLGRRNPLLDGASPDHPNVRFLG